jgi:hypothetical protein
MKTVALVTLKIEELTPIERDSSITKTHAQPFGGSH